MVESSDDEDETVNAMIDSDDEKTKQRVLTEIREDRRRTWNVIAQFKTKEELLERDNTPFDPDEDERNHFFGRFPFFGCKS